MNPSFQNSVFFVSYLQNMQFNGANLSGVNFSHSDLRYADLSGANIKGANFTDAKIKYMNVRGAIYDSTTKIPKSFIRGKYMERK